MIDTRLGTRLCGDGGKGDAELMVAAKVKSSLPTSRHLGFESLALQGHLNTICPDCEDRGVKDGNSD